MVLLPEMAHVTFTPKWQNWYTGPYLVIRLVDSYNVVIRKTRRSRPIVTHRDKLNACLDPEAHEINWLGGETDDAGNFENEPHTGYANQDMPDRRRQ